MLFSILLVLFLQDTKTITNSDSCWIFNDYYKNECKQITKQNKPFNYIELEKESSYFSSEEPDYNDIRNSKIPTVYKNPKPVDKAIQDISTSLKIQTILMSVMFVLTTLVLLK